MDLSKSDLQARKNSGSPIAMLTAYDSRDAAIGEEAGVDILLVGDSLGTVVLGFPSVRNVTLNDMIHHASAVVRGVKHTPVLVDLPFGYCVDPEKALHASQKIGETGAGAVKIEGESESLDAIAAVVEKGISVCGHIGYRPQTHIDGARVQGKELDRARDLIQVAPEIERAGASMIVLELVPAQIARKITEIVSIPTIGIGAGPWCCGQVQVCADIWGLSPRTFKHAKVFSNARGSLVNGAQRFTHEVHSGTFPTLDNAVSVADEFLEQLDREN